MNPVEWKFGRSKSSRKSGLRTWLMSRGLFKNGFGNPTPEQLLNSNFANDSHPIFDDSKILGRYYGGCVGDPGLPNYIHVS